MDLPSTNSLFERFLQLARSPQTQDSRAVECCDEKWTYADVDSISSGIAEELQKSHGTRPTVAIVSENHPYTLAVLLATWKLGGIAAPIDYHTPKDILTAMLLDIKPTCALVPDTEAATRRIVSGSFVSFFFPSFVEPVFMVNGQDFPSHFFLSILRRRLFSLSPNGSSTNPSTTRRSPRTIRLKMWQCICTRPLPHPLRISNAYL